MPEYRYARGRILESIRFISEELKEFESEYVEKTQQEYQDDRRLQKIIDRTVETILTALIEICGTVLAEEGISADSYGDTVKRCAKLFGLSDEEQERLSRLAVQRNRLAHRYLNFRWQAVKMFASQRGSVTKLIAAILEREERQ